MRTSCGLIAACAALMLVPASSPAQSHVVVRKTLVPSSAHRECLGMSQKQVLRYGYRSDTPVEFKIDHVMPDEMATPVKHEVRATGAGSLEPKAAGDYCLVWTNAGSRPALIRVELARLPR